MNQNVYYLRDKVLCTGGTPVTQTSLCLTNVSATDYSDRSLNAIYSAMTIKCYECYTKEMLMSSNYLTLLSDFGLYASDCVPQNTDSCMQSPGGTMNAPCSINEFQDQNGKCTSCSEKFANCAYCNSTNCLMCIQNYFWMDNSTYQYQYSRPEIPPGREKKCTFDTCDIGYCQNTDIFTCEKQQSTTTNCLKCTSSQGTQTCQICKNGYYLESGQCQAFPSNTLNLNLYVKSTTSLYTRASTTPGGGGAGGSTTPSTSTSTTTSCTTTAQTKPNTDPSVWSKASPFLQYALRYLYQQENRAKKIVANIYLTKGTHFFFSCSGSESVFDTKKEMENIYKYCENWDLYRYHVTENDNFEINLLPLECKLGTTLGLASDTNFQSLCVDFSKGDAKPTVHVNNPYTYFNITGKLSIQNIKFSGINALVQAVSAASSDIDFSVYPQLYCQQTYDVSGHVKTFSPTVLETCLNDTAAIGYTCKDPLASYLQSPPLKFSSDDNCGTQFNKTQYSTLACSGEAYDADYFTLSSDGRNIYAWRRKTLFNMYGFPQHRTNRDGASPELVINNCEFEYFLAKGYESLITIETNSLSTSKVAEKIILEEDETRTETQTFYIYNSQDRGAKINITDSKFKNSRFCKGMIVYRPTFYDSSSTTLLNQTNLYMTNVLKNHADTFIILKNSTFYNMNAFSTVYSLAITGQAALTTTLSGGSLQEDVTYPMFVHKGIILNVEDFQGTIEIVDCTFEKNMHYIPSILYTGDSQASLSLEMFTDTYTTKELQFKVCDISTRQYTYFFGGSTVMSQLAGTDLDTFFDSYERLGMIYISRNNQPVIIKGSTFTDNIGTFGGAITINSPNWQGNSQPHVVITDNLFYGNMAYFSGNAMYLRNTMYDNEKWMNENATCGGVNIIGNIFQDNIGMKVHNGGAISAYCYYIDYIYHQDIETTSRYDLNKPQVSIIQAPNDEQIYVQTKTDQTTILIQKYKFNIEGNLFQNNFSGGKGTALYIRQMSKVRIYDNQFLNNQPTLAVAEQLYSPYTKYISMRSMTFYDADCVDELEFLETCYLNNDVSSFGGVQWPKVQGTVHVIFCETDDCLNYKLMQELEITLSIFSKNIAGPTLDEITTDTASQIFVRGGMSVKIGECTFSDNQGSRYLFSKTEISKIANYFPKSYLEYSHSPLINILMTPPTKVKFNVQMSFDIYSSKFYGNRNIQVLGLTSTTQYQGSLIQMSNLATSDPSNDQILSLTIEDCDFRDNIFTGPESSLINAHKILTKVQRSTFINNGRISEYIIEKKRSEAKTYTYNTSVEFDFKSYEFQDIQSYGCICLEGDTALASPHEIVNNTFSYIFAQQGSVLTLLSMDSQEIYLSGNTYEMIFAENEGAIVYWERNSKKATLLMENEKSRWIFGYNQGAVRIKPLKKQVANLIINNTSFDNMYSQYGSSISLFEVGKVKVSNTNFTKVPLNQISNQSNLTNYTLGQFKPYKLQMLNNFINSTILQKMLAIERISGMIDLQYVKNIITKTDLTFNGQTLQMATDPYFEYCEFINCNFIGNEALSYAGIYTYDVYIRVANELTSTVQKTVNTTVTTLVGDTATNTTQNGQWWKNPKPKNVTTNVTQTQNVTFYRPDNPFYLANNTFYSQGVFGFEGSTKFVLENLQFLNNTAKTKAASLYLTSSSSGQVVNSSFISNVAKSSGVVIIEGNCFVDFKQCLFENNWAKDSSALFAQNNPDSIITFVDSNFTNNTAGTNLINLLYSNANISNSSFVDNIAQSVNHGITLINSQANLLNITVNYTNSDFLNKNTYTVDTGFFNLNYQSTLTLSNSIIQNTRGAMASVLYVTGQSSAYLINNTRITYCFSKEGDAVLANLAKILYIDQVSFFANQQTDVYVQQTPTYIRNSRFAYSPLTSVYVTSSTIELVNNSFFDGYYQYLPENGNAMYCDCQGEVLIQNNTFEQLSAVKGGAIFLGTSSRTSDQKFVVKDNRFIRNSAQQGGAIYLQDTVKMELTGNIFEGNFAIKIENNNVAAKLPDKGMAGAFYYACEIEGIFYLPTDAPDYRKKCVVEFQGTNNFINNSAHDGGAILWVKDRPLYAADSNINFSQNEAFYGENIGSYPGGVKMEFISNNDYVNPYNQTTSALRVLQEDSGVGKVPTLVSGNTIDFNLVIVDQDGNVYKTDSSSKAVIDKENPKINDTILLNNEVIAKNGVYQFRDVKLISKPGSNASLKLAISGLESFGNSISFLDNPIKFSADVRKCVAGEELTDDGKCLVCPAGTFQYFVPETKTSCQTCPKDAVCYGKSTVAPQYGYWRSSNTSSNFIKCPNFDICLGGNEEYPNGQCREGYQGIVCGDCQKDYSKTKQFTCGKCPDRTRNMIQTIFILVAYVGYVSFLVRSTLASADKQKPVHSVYMKILTNHFQILGAISNIDYQWPKVIEDFQESQKTVSSASEQVFSFDCFLMGKNGTDEGVPVFFQKLIMFGLMPAIAFFVCLAFWAIVGRIQKKTLEEFRGKFISTLIVVLFLVHPDIAKSMFLTFNCLEIDGVFRMKENIRSVCYKDQHLFFISAVAFPSIGIWVFGIPLFALIVLIKNRRVLTLMTKKEITQKENEEITELKTKYGFLFAGYGPRTFFWEVIIMYRKILIIMTSVFLSTVSSESQVLVVIFIIVMSMFLQIRFQPYYTPTLNQMENYSLQVAAVTIYTGMYYVTGKHYDYMNNQAVSWFFLVCIALPNIVFILYWVYNMRIEVVKMLYHSKLPEWIFKTVAWQSRERFCAKVLRKIEEFEKANEVKIIESIEKKDPEDFDKIEDRSKFESQDSKNGKTKGEQLMTPYDDQMNKPEKSSNTLDEFRMDQTEFSHRGDRYKIKEIQSSRHKKYKVRGDTTAGPDEQTPNWREERYKKSKNAKSFIRQWEHIPSTARSMKVHPESIINTARQPQALVVLNDIELVEDPEYSTPGDDEPEQINQSKMNGFALNNSKMMEHLQRNQQKKDDRRSPRRDHDNDDNLRELKKSNKRSKRYKDQEMRSPGRSRSPNKNDVSQSKRRYEGEDIDVNDINFDLQDTQFDSNVRLNNGQIFTDRRQQKQLPTEFFGTVSNDSPVHQNNQIATTFDPSKLRAALTSSLSPPDIINTNRSNLQQPLEGEEEPIEISSEIGQLTQTIKFDGGALRNIKSKSRSPRRHNELPIEKEKKSHRDKKKKKSEKEKKSSRRHHHQDEEQVEPRPKSISRTRR